MGTELCNKILRFIWNMYSPNQNVTRNNSLRLSSIFGKGTILSSLWFPLGVQHGTSEICWNEVLLIFLRQVIQIRGLFKSQTFTQNSNILWGSNSDLMKFAPKRSDFYQVVWWHSSSYLCFHICKIGMPWSVVEVKWDNI